MKKYTDCAIGIDIGGTNCKIGAVDGNGTVIVQSAFEVDHSAGIDTFLASLFKSVDLLLSELEANLTGIGVLLPGYLKEQRTIPYIMVNIPMLENVPLYSILSERYAVPIALDIDRNGPCLAEYKFEYSCSVDRLMYVTIGTGVGVGLVVNGQVCRVTNDSIGELGHVPFEVEGFECVCGNRGCVETIVSKIGIARIAERLNIREISAEGLEGKMRKAFDPNNLYLAAYKGNKEAIRIFHEFGRYLGAALVIYANTFSPDLVVVGGGLSGASEYFLKVAEEYLNNHWFERRTKRIPLRKSIFGNNAGIIGAAALVI